MSDPENPAPWILDRLASLEGHIEAQKDLLGDLLRFMGLEAE